MYLKKLRIKFGLTQGILAGKLDMTRQTYAQIEGGDRKLNVDEAQKLASIFGLKIEDFLNEKMPIEVDVKLEVKKNKKKSLVKSTASRLRSMNEMRISIPQNNLEKFKEVFLYILEEIGARPNIGEAVICKLLYFIDFDYYEKYEEQLIGAKYISNHHGPTPAGFKEITQQMIADGEIVGVMKKYFQFDQKKYLPLRSADLSKLNAREKELIDNELERFKDFNAAKMREYSHRDVPWIGTEDMKVIDYEAVFARTEEFSQRQYED